MTLLRSNWCRRLRAALLGVVAVLPLAGCATWGLSTPRMRASESQGLTVEQAQFTQDAQNVVLAYVRRRVYAQELMEYYDSRSSMNRGALYVGSTVVLGLTSASAGLAAFGAAATAAARSLPISATFVNALSGLFDNRQHAQLYTDAANELRTRIADADDAFLREPDPGARRDKVGALEKATADVVNRVEIGRNNLAPSPDRALAFANQVRERIEEEARIKPKITGIKPSVARPVAGIRVELTGSGLDDKTQVYLDGERAKQISATAGFVWFETPKADGVRSYRVTIVNRYDRSAEAPIRLVQADLQVNECLVAPHPTDEFLAVVNVIGQGFVREGQVTLTSGDEVLTPKAPPTWQTHTRWEVVVSRGDTEKPITSIKVVNPTDNMQASGTEITKPADCKISAKR